MAAPKTDKVTIDFNLDKLEAPEEFRAQKFVFKGERFETVDPKEIVWEDMAKAYASGNDRKILNLFLGSKEQVDKFWSLKPTILHVKAFVDEIGPVLQAMMGDEGESDDS